MSLPASTAYLRSGNNELPQWTRIDTEAAPNGDVYVAWQASGSIHVTPLTSAGKRTGSDIVVSGAQEVGGFVALDNGFALLTRKADTQKNMWNETAAYLLRDAVVRGCAQRQRSDDDAADDRGAEGRSAGGPGQKTAET